MEARLVAAQRGLIWLLVVSIGVILLCLPRPGDARIAHGFAELSLFEQAVDLPATERTRRTQAMQFAQVSLADLLELPSDAESGRAVKRERNVRGAKWRVSESASPVLSLASLRLATLEDVVRQSQGATQADVGVPQTEAVRSALAFRLAHLQLPGIATIESALLETAELSMHDVELQREGARLRGEVAEAKASLERAEHKVEIANKRVDARKKRRSRSIQKFQEQLATANTQRDEKAAAFQTLQSRYDELASQAVRASEEAAAIALPNGIPEVARLRIALQDAQGKAQSIAIAVPLERRSVSLPPLVIPGVSAALPALRATSAWPELKLLSPTAALAGMGGRLSWQSRQVSLLGLVLDGSWLLQGSPVLIALALIFAARRAASAASSYRLFSTEVRGSLRRVGFDKRIYELLVVVVLPLSACVLSASSLGLLHRWPVLPALAFTLCSAFAVRLFNKLDELRVLNRSITQYHSYPPPAGPAELEGSLEPEAA